MSDVFSDDSNAPPIVDCDVLEAAKENIQPLASGRRVTALSAILSTPHAQRESRLADARRRHRANVEIAMEDEDEDADPLEAYSRFVYWTVENYPQGHSAESGLLELLEEATRVLRDDRGGKWRGDLRYLKLWTLYASYVDKPTVIYKYLLVNDIGTSHALFYEEYALALERAGRRVEADEKYMLGIARKAAPLERLEAKYRDFQKRMMASPTLPSSSSASTSPDPPAPSSTSATTVSRRRPLGDPAATSSSSSSSRTRSSRAGSVRAPSISEDVFAAPSAPRPNGRMPIFVDPSGDAENDPDQAINPTPWPELGTRKSRIKENTMEVSKAAGTTLRQAASSRRAASGPKITVFRDPAPEEEPSEAMPPPPVPAAKQKGKLGGKSSIAIFRDEDDQPSKSKPSIPSTPKFVPFKDDEPGSPSTSSSVPTTATKPKPAPAVKPFVMSAEGEALRRDPFKNYSPDEKPTDD